MKRFLPFFDLFKFYLVLANRGNDMTPISVESVVGETVILFLFFSLVDSLFSST